MDPLNYSRPSDSTDGASTEASASSHEVEAVLAQIGRFLGQPFKSSLPDLIPSEANEQEDDLEESFPSLDARYRVLVEQIPAVVFMAFVDGGISEAYVSPHIEQMLGFLREEWLDDPIRWYQQIHPDDRQRWSIEAAEIFLIGKPLKSTYRVIARDGHVVWFRCEAKLVRRKNGQPWFIHGVGFDITELKRTELALQEASAERERLQKLELERQIAKTEQTEIRLAAIVESSEDAIISTTLDGVVTTWNAAATLMFGYSPEEMIGKSVLLLVRPESHVEEMHLFSRLKSGQQIDSYDTQRITKRGKRVDLSLTVSPIRDAMGQVVGASTIARDITERKQMQEALRSSERYAAMGRVAAVLAHEINNPLEAVTNTFYLLRKYPVLDEQAKELMRIAETELARVNHITKQTLGLYRQSDRPTVVSLRTILNDILEVYSRKLHSFGISIDSRVSTDGLVLGFPVELRQVFLNLVSNAIQAMPEGGRLRVHLYRSESWKGYEHGSGVRVNVVDTGMGIRPENRGKIFQPFFTTKDEKGTGLGLWVSRGIIQKLEGSITARSCTVAGKTMTCFSVFLPGEEVPEP
jgi:PAS domain S-box-containing protein